MKIPDWAPIELVNARKNLIKIIEDNDELSRGDVLRKERFSNGRRYVGPKILSPNAELRVLEALISSDEMKNFWRLIKKRKNTFKPTRLEGIYLYCGHPNQVLNLYAACLSAKWQWNNSSKLTLAEQKKSYEDISSRAKELAELLIDANLNKDLRIESYVLRSDRDKILADIKNNPSEYPSQKITKYKFTVVQWADILLEMYEDILPSIPDILEALSIKINEQIKQHGSIKKPNSKDAEAHLFVRVLSQYFLSSYGTPLHEHVKVIANAVLGVSITAENVRALVRLNRVPQKSP